MAWLICMCAEICNESQVPFIRYNTCIPTQFTPPNTNTRCTHPQVPTPAATGATVKNQHTTQYHGVQHMAHATVPRDTCGLRSSAQWSRAPPSARGARRICGATVPTCCQCQHRVRAQSTCIEYLQVAKFMMLPNGSSQRLWIAMRGPRLYGTVLSQPATGTGNDFKNR